MAPLFYTLEAGRLIKPTTTAAGEQSLELIDDFIKRFSSIDERIAWTSPNARSNLVVHPDDRNLRIDFQKPITDPTRPGPQWANFQLQHGENSHACILMIMGPHYPAVDIRAAWLASLEKTRNARLIWRFLAKKAEFAILKSLDNVTPREVDEIARRVRELYGWGVPNVMGLEFHHDYITQKRFPEALQQLVGANLAARRPTGWVITADGSRYLITAVSPFLFGG